MMEQKTGANAPQERTSEFAPLFAERRIRNVSEDDDDFLLDDFFDDDFEYRRRQARRPELNERQYFDFWD